MKVKLVSKCGTRDEVHGRLPADDEIGCGPFDPENITIFGDGEEWLAEGTGIYLFDSTKGRLQMWHERLEEWMELGEEYELWLVGHDEPMQTS